MSQFCDTVLFGSECGNIELLTQGGEIAASEQFRTAYRAALAEGEPAAAAYYRMLYEHGVGELSSNDLLGVEYIRATRELGAELQFLTVKRQGASYGSTDLTPGEYPSARSIRRLWNLGRFAESEAYLPAAAVEVYRRAYGEGRQLDPVRLDALWLSFFRLHKGTELEGIAGTEGGLANRICATASQVSTMEALIAGIRTKRYTDTHLQRVMLYCLAGVRPEELLALPCYTTLLGVSRRGRELLAEKRKAGSLPVITKPADAPKDTAQYRLGERITSAYATVLKHPRSSAELLTAKPYVES